jgi:hypothetical protein
MQQEHEQLIELYEKNSKLRDKADKKAVVIQGLIVLIVCAMKVIQDTASLNLNILAASCVTFLTVWHFWDFNYRRLLDSEKTQTILIGVEMERKNPFAGLSFFFRDYMKKFNPVGAIAGAALFDVGCLYFFSVSVTQLLKIANPEIVAKLAPSTSFRTFLISAYLVFAYYRPIKPLAHLKNKLAY